MALWDVMHRTALYGLVTVGWSRCIRWMAPGISRCRCDNYGEAKRGSMESSRDAHGAEMIPLFRFVWLNA